VASHARRYLPFAAFVAVQLIVVLLAPSRPSVSAGPALGGTSPVGIAGSTTATGGTATGGTAAVGPGGSPIVPGTAAVGGKHGKGATTVPTGSGPIPSTAATGATTGSGSSGTTQRTGFGPGTFCVHGVIEHSPCIKKWYGGSNGGATWQGVTAKSITVIMYRPQDNAAVDAILRATGTYIAPADEQAMLAVAQKFINTHYQLYGRTIRYIWMHGTCAIAPPDDACFRTEADKINAKYHPFALFYDSDTAESAFMDELSRKGIVNWGGWGFNDAFDQSLRPYHYDLFMGGDVQAELAGEFWCSALAGRKAIYAGGVLRTQIRKVAVVYPNANTVTASAKHLEAIINKCDPRGALDAPYSSNTSTAASQSTADTAREKAAGVTSIIWMSDPIAPAYGTVAQNEQRWQPEEILAGGELVDYDPLAQTYNSNVWKHAFGLSDLANAAPVTSVDAGVIWREEGHSGAPNSSANLLTTYALAVAGGIQAAGPVLTPLKYEAGLLSLPGYDAWSQWHNPLLTYLKWGPGDYTGISDVRLVYWDPNAVSNYNHKRGAYIPLHGGQRYQIGQLPKSISLPAGV
jgi:hypothetical protein